MSEPLHVIARIRANPDHLDELIEAFGLLVEHVLGEHGCLRYEMMQSVDDPAILVFVEEWASRDDWDAHMEGGALAAHRERVGPDWIADTEVHPVMPLPS